MATFSQNMRRWANKVDAGLDEVVNSVCLQLSTSIIKRTPVGNPSLWQSKPPKGYVGGAARGNWIPSIGQPSFMYDAKNIDSSGQDSISATAAVASGAAGNVFYLVNNLPYIGRLEYQGWSTQAPVGMVRVSVIEVQQAIEKAVSEL
jgi:hypothetical protein